MSNMRGYNFIEDYSLLLGKYENVSQTDILTALNRCVSKNNIETDVFGNFEYECKRFISWFHRAYNAQFEELIKLDETGFLNKCISLYDPRIGNAIIPISSEDYRPVYD